MKIRILVAFIVSAALLSGGWYAWNWEDRKIPAAMREQLETASKLVEELQGLRLEMESVRLKADEAAKRGDAATQRQFVERMKSVETKTLEVERRLLPYLESRCKGERKLAVESKTLVTDRAEKAQGPSAHEAQLKGCGPGG